MLDILQVPATLPAMNAITTLTPQQLRKAADLKERLDALQEQLNEILGGEVLASLQAATEAPVKPKNGRRRKRRKMSPEGRANIRAAQKARRAAERGEAQPETVWAAPEATPKKKRSAAWSRALSAAMKARWAKARAAGKTKL